MPQSIFKAAATGTSSDPLYVGSTALAQDTTLQGVSTALTNLATTFTKSSADEPGSAVSVGTSSTSLLSSNSDRIAAIIMNDHATAVVYVRLAGTGATVNQGIRLNPAGGSFVTPPGYTGPICAISDTAATTVLITDI